VIVREIGSVDGSPLDVRTDNWRSRRLLVAGDGVGFSMHETVVRAGSENEFWYANHVEAVWVIEGEGELVDLTDGTRHELRPGTLYVLDGHERHRLLPRTDLRTICVFNPAVVGPEVHAEDGSYAAPADV
jgi:L-ectoine synthase